MVWLQLRGVTASFGMQTVLDDVDVEIHENERLGLVGENGAGKSTLLSILAGERPPDRGTVRRQVEVGWVRQFGPAEGVRDAELDARLKAQEARPGLSGGEQTRLRLARAFGQHAPLLLLDEPTANLDWAGREELERLLIAHTGGFVLVSHDRALLDQVCKGILALEKGKLTRYSGGWSAYREQWEASRERARFEYEQYRTEEKRLKQAVQGLKESRSQVRKTPKRMGNSEARLHKRESTNVQKQLDRIKSALETRLEHLDVKDRPREETHLRISDAQFEGIGSATAIRIEGLTLYAGSKHLLDRAAMTVPAQGCTALLGPNGSGKSTLLRTIAKGREGIRLSPGVRLGYFSQDALETLDPALSVLDNVMRMGDCLQQDARAVLARLGLREGDVGKAAGLLSGGERAKCLLAALLLGPSNVLLLDEPGNYLDIYALEALESLLGAYPGAIVLVSHDRRLVERIGRRIVRIESKKLDSWDGTLGDFMQRHRAQAEVDENVIRMRMAELSARIASPRRGEDVLALRAAWDEEAAKLRGIR